MELQSPRGQGDTDLPTHVERAVGPGNEASFQVVFVISARESNRNRINMAKRGGFQ